MESKKLRVDIWSDIVCPFCYIGKRKFESALKQFEHRDDLEIVWHSFQLFPNYQQQSDKDFYQILAEIKGQSRDWSVDFHSQLAGYAKEVGLEFNFENIPFPNTFKAHRFTHLAKNEGLQLQAEERLFYAYFTECRDIENNDVLLEIAEEIGINKEKVEDLLKSDLYEKEVREDFARAQTLGIRGVPYFLIADELAVAGAQSPEKFLEVLEGGWRKWKNNKTPFFEQSFDGLSCGPKGQCN
jgi:predicted DsbA family dithiol-disulfide isomerase